MSWPNRPPGTPAEGPGAAQQPYVVPQQVPQNIYQSYPNVAAQNSNMQQQQYWHMQGPQQQYNEQYGQQYPRTDLTNNANNFYQPHPQNYTNQTYNTSQASGYQQNYYQNQQSQQIYTQNKQNKDAWEDNWDWGWGESKQGQQSVSTTQGVVPQQASFNNANIIEESFNNSDSWKWSADDKNGAETQCVPSVPEPSKVQSNLPITTPVEYKQTNEANNQRRPSNQSAPVSGAEEPAVRTLNDRNAVKEHMPNLALGKRFHLENLTPQWSIESQMSQESSDGPHTHSESTYRSDNQSRNSSKSSPGLNTENSNFNYSQLALDEMSPQITEWPKDSVEDATIVDNDLHGEAVEVSHDEIVSTLRELSITNQENATMKPKNEEFVHREQQEGQSILPLDMMAPKIGHQLVAPNAPPHQTVSSKHPQTLPSHSPSPSNFGLHSSNYQPPSLNNTLPSTNLPPPPLRLPTPPSLPLPSQGYPTSSSPASLPPSLATSAPSQNPYKLSGPFSHKSAGKSHSTKSPSLSQPPFTPGMPNDLLNPTSSTNLSSPVVVSQITQQHTQAPLGYPTANLETTPDNSERPDHPHVSAFRPIPAPHQVPENLEVAPRSDRNEYLQTAHLSSHEFSENTNFSRNVPTPGFRRMVVGQQESEFSQNLNLSSDEPPPGLARMVPGQQTESDNSYSQSGENYMDRHIDGQSNQTNDRNPFRQADGQQTLDNYSQSATRTDRRSIGFDRMVPGESSNNDYARSQQYQTSTYSANEQRVVTGLDHDYIPTSSEIGLSDVREQNVDGSDYMDHNQTSQTRNVMGARDLTSDVSIDYNSLSTTAQPELEHQREQTMEGENLQDLSIISSTELSFSREQILDGTNINVGDNNAAKTDLSDSLDLPPNGSRRQSLNRVNTSGEESERDRSFKTSPRRDRDKHKSSRDRDRDKDRYSRDTKRFDVDANRKSGRDRDDRRLDKESRRSERDKRNRDESPDGRKHRRSTRSHRYETEDTDYYSDRERERRRYREGSYTSSKPPRPDEKDRRYRDDRDRNKRYATIERERRYELDERDGATRSRRGDRDKDDRRYEAKYRDIDPTRKYGNLRREEEERRRGVDMYSSPSRADSGGGEDELNDTMISTESRRRGERRKRSERHHHHDQYYEGYNGGYGDPYMLQRQQQTYQYYEHLRLTNPTAYMEIYNKIMAGQPLPPPPLSEPLRPVPLYSGGYGVDERGSVHSGRSSNNNLTLNTDFNTDASLNLQFEDSTVRSERMTPFKFSTAHVKGVLSAQHVVVVQPTYPVDGRPATVTLLELAAVRADPDCQQLLQYPGPLIKGVTHKKSVVEYCARQSASAARGDAWAGRDAAGGALLWDLLALLLRQNGVVVGADIAELLLKNQREYDLTPISPQQQSTESRRGSEQSSRSRSPELEPEPEPQAPSTEEESRRAPDEKQALERLREHLMTGDTQQALELATRRGLWAHALQLAAWAGPRARSLVWARFLASLPPADPLHSLYAARAALPVPAVKCISSEKWGDWRPHLAIMLANPSNKPELDSKNIIQMGDSLMARGLEYSAQFCYVCGGAQLEPHPLAPLGAAPSAAPAPDPALAPALAPAPAAAPPRLSLLLAPAQAASLPQLAHNRALFATEIYEYACSLHQDFTIDSFQVYKLVLATRLLDCGQVARAALYAEHLARALTAAPQRHSAVLLRQAAALAHRLSAPEPTLHEALEGETESPETPQTPHEGPAWLRAVQAAAEQRTLQLQTSAPVPPEPALLQQTNYSWAPEQPPQQYLQPQGEAHEAHEEAAAPEPERGVPQYYGDDWFRPPEPEHAYWQGDQHSLYSYSEEREPAAGQGQGQWQGQGQGQWHGQGQGQEGREPPEWAEPGPPAISMPGAAPTSRPALYDDYDESPGQLGENDKFSNKSNTNKEQSEKSKEEGKGAKSGSWFGGFLTKLALRPPNQMILPDDKNPSIVWDAEQKRWKNLDSGDDDAVSGALPPPPPRAASAPAPALAPPMAPTDALPPMMPPAAPVSNMFKMQKGRHIKKAYVDVLNPSPGSRGAPPPPAPLPAPANLNYFVPQPMNMQPTDDPYLSGT